MSTAENSAVSNVTDRPELRPQKKEFELGQYKEFMHDGAVVKILRISDGFYICECVQWKNATVAGSVFFDKNAKQQLRTCKHLAMLRGEQAEKRRMQVRTQNPPAFEPEVCCNLQRDRRVVYSTPRIGPRWAR